jgi:hypothetical protein
MSEETTLADPINGHPQTARDILAAAGATEALAALPTKDPDADPEEGTAKSVASRLVALAEERYRVVQAADGRPYAIDKDGPMIAFSLRGKDGLRIRLGRTYYARHKTAPGGSALSDALTVLEGMATEHDPEPVGLRVATTAAGDIVLDLGTVDGRCVVADATGWSVQPRSPVLFRRTTLTSPLPTPQRHGSLDPLRQLLNVNEQGFRLLVGWLVAALIPDIPHPILTLTGEQGTAKSTAARLTVSLIDPSPAPLRTAPRDIKQWSVTAAASWTVALDNISTIPAWLSDTLCKAVTGDGMVDRALFTDDDVTVLSFRRVIAMTSIDAGSLAGDLAERLLPVELSRIDPEQRRTDAEISAAYDAARPAVLGAVLDLLVGVLQELPAVHLDRLPRMAGFTRILAALDQVTGWTTVADYTSTAAEVAEAVIESDPFAEAIRAQAALGDWAGTAAQLMELITPDTPPRTWPRSARAVSGALRRLAPALRSAGIAIEFTRSTDASHRRLITITNRHPPNQPSEPSEPSDHPH